MAVPITPPISRADTIENLKMSPPHWNEGGAAYSCMRLSSRQRQD